MRSARSRAVHCSLFWLSHCLGTLLLSHGSVAHAFSEPQIYADAADGGGGGGRWFTGSPAEGYDCSVCHTGNVKLPLYQSGLPLDGYVPGTGYTIKLSWPEANVQALSALAAGLRPSTSVVAELVSEDGSPSGTIDLQPSFATRSEFCTTAADGSTMLAASVFSVSGDSPATRGSVCSATQKGQRCVVAVSACGSSELRMRWTAPERWGGPIWFSASLVSTANTTGVPDDGADGVTSLAFPLNAASEVQPYETRLSAGCTVSGAPLTSPHGHWSIALALLAACCYRHRRARGERTVDKYRAFVVCTCACSIVLCACEEPPPQRVISPDVGLFTPGYRPVGAPPPQTAGATALDGGSTNPAALCMGQTFQTDADADGGASGPGGTLAIDFTTGLLPAGDYDKGGMQENYGVVWIEDDMGRYVSGLSQWGTKYRLRLATWSFGKGRPPPSKARVGCDDPDLITSATLHAHSAHSLTWNGTDTAHQVVPDGNYTLWLEVQIDERHVQSAVTFPVVKGRMPWMQPLAPAAPLQALTLTYTPDP